MDLERRRHLRIDDVRERSQLPTPALVCEIDALDANIARMAEAALKAGVSLRPHVKSHKSAFIARRQLDHGAAGLSCAKISEAEAVLAGLVRDGYHQPVSVLITSPVAGPMSARRVAALAGRCELSVVVDHPLGVDELSLAALDVGVRLGVLCDVDVGLGRTGVTGSREAVTIAERIDASAGLDFAGVQGYGGHLQHVVGRDARVDATKVATQRLRSVVEALESSGYPVDLRTGGGTGTAGIDIELGLLNELQVGSYVFMDREYRDALGSDPEGRFEQSLTIATTVISTNQEDFVTVDAGLKAMATDAGVPLVVDHEDSAEYMFFGDEHGLVTRAGDFSPQRGARLELVPPHCDPTVDRYDVIWLVRGSEVLGVADVVARGCSQ